MTVSMKRFRDDDDREVEHLAMANCLMLLSRLENKNKNKNNSVESPTLSGRVFKCKTCDKEFQSFQALGGHRASHKKPKLFPSEVINSKPKTHECSICGLDFAIGQALGGHMRRHRGEKIVEEMERNIDKRSAPVVVMPQLIRRSNSKRVLCLDLDLNLTPLENDLKLGNQSGPILQLGF